MAKKVKRTKSSPVRSSSSSKKDLSPVMQVGVVFVIVAAMLLLMYAARISP